MRELMDSVHFDSASGSGTTVHLEKRLAWKPDAAIHELVTQRAGTPSLTLSSPELSHGAGRPRSLALPPSLGCRNVAARIGVVTFPGLVGRPGRAARRPAWPAVIRSRCGTATPTCSGSTRWCSPAVSPTATTCAPARSPASHRSSEPSSKPPRRGHAGPRHLQRLPGPLRGTPTARRADPERRHALRLPRPVAAGGEHRRPPGRRPSTPTPVSDVLIPVKHGEGRYVASTETPGRARGRRARRLPLPRRESERVAERHRRASPPPTAASSA